MIKQVRSLLVTGTIKDSFVSMVGLVFSAFAGTVFTILTARGLGPETFGIFSAIWAIVQIFSAIGDFGLSSALINFLPKHTRHRDAVVSTIFSLQLKLTFLLITFLFFMSFYHATIIPGSKASSLYWSVILVFLDILGLFALNLLRAEKLFVKATVLQVIEAVTKTGLVATLFIFKTVTIDLAIIISLIGIIISTIYGFWGQFHLLVSKVGDFSVSKVVHYSKWIALSRFFSVMVARIDPILLNLLAGNFAAGIFSAASRITMLFTLIISSLGSVIGPRFSSFSDPKVTNAYLKKLIILISFIGLGMLGSVIIARPLILLVFGNKYIDSIGVFQALTIAMIPFLYTTATTAPLIYTYNQTKFFLLITAVQVTTMVVLEIVLIPKFGAYAPTISVGISNLVILVVSGLKLIALSKNT